MIGSCKHDVIELGQLSQRYEQTTRKSLLSQLSQRFRPWTVGTMDCPNVLNRLVGTLGTIVPTFEHTTTFCLGQLSQVEMSKSVRARPNSARVLLVGYNQTMPRRPRGYNQQRTYINISFSIGAKATIYDQRDTAAHFCAAGLQREARTATSNIKYIIYAVCTLIVTCFNQYNSSWFTATTENYRAC